MTKEELMVGNMVDYDGFNGFVQGIVGGGWIDIKDVKSLIEVDEIKPVEITHEILLSFGFNQLAANEREYLRMGNPFSVRKTRYDIYCVCRHCGKSAEWILDVIHIHTLQNILRLLGHPIKYETHEGEKTNG